MFEAMWFLSGLAGALLVWRMFKRIERFDPDFTWCPSPLGIFFMLVASAAGPILLVASASATFVFYLEDLDWKNSWLTRPICRK